MKSDPFWKSFWLIVGTSFFASVVVSAFLFVQHINQVDAAAVGVTYDATKDPFEFAAQQNRFTLTNGELYKDALPLGLQQWNWDAKLSWHSTNVVHSGTGSLQIDFQKPWAGMGLSGFTVKQSSYSSLSLAVYPDSSVGDLYIEVYDKNSTALVRQSIGWYAPGGALVPNQWQVITIPLGNLTGSSTSGAVTGISISTTKPGTAFIDDITFGNDTAPHAPWSEPSWEDKPPFNPFATTTPEALPYKASFANDAFNHWYSYYGYFGRDDSSLKIGPSAPQFNDSLAILRGGRFWTDYSIKATVNWGITSTFSLLARVTDAQNYASCAYSTYGQTVQIYQVKNGVTTMLGQTPALPVDHDKPWIGMTARMVVKGGSVTCYSNGDKVLSADLDAVSPNGTVGFEAWDKNPNSSPHAIVSYEVDPVLGE